MRLIVLDDANYFRRVAVERLFTDFSPRDNHVVVSSIHEAKELMRMYCRRYREVIVIGTPPCYTVKHLTQFFLRMNPGMQLRFFLFSDMIGLPQLKQHLVVSARVVFLAPNIANAGLLRFVYQQNNRPRDECLIVKFNGNDESVIRLWRQKLTRNLAYCTMTTRNYNHSRSLKKRLDVHNEYGLCLLWHFVCCAVSDYQWKIPPGSRLPECQNPRAGHYHPLVQRAPGLRFPSPGEERQHAGFSTFNF